MTVTVSDAQQLPHYPLLISNTESWALFSQLDKHQIFICLYLLLIMLENFRQARAFVLPYNLETESKNEK